MTQIIVAKEGVEEDTKGINKTELLGSIQDINRHLILTCSVLLVSQTHFVVEKVLPVSGHNCCYRGNTKMTAFCDMAPYNLAGSC